MRKLKHTLLTKIKTNPSGAAVISLFAFIIFTARFIYVPFIGEWDVEYPDRIFGFKWLSIFLSRIGNEVAWLAMGLVLMYFSSFMEDKMRSHAKNLAALVIITALYFISWCLIDESNFNDLTEILFSMTTAVMAYILSRQLFTASARYVEKLKAKTRFLFQQIVFLVGNDSKKEHKVGDILTKTIQKLDE